VKVWWLTQQTRLALERSRIEALCAQPWFENPFWDIDKERLRLRLSFDLVFPDRRVSLQLVYHDTFPDSPPSIFPATEQRLSGHQYGQDGELCLNIREDNWMPEYTGGDMVEGAYELLSSEAPGANGESTSAPSAHNVPNVQRLRKEALRFHLTLLGQFVMMTDVLDGARVKLAMNSSETGHLVANLISIELQGEAWPLPDVPAAMAEEFYVVDAQLICVPSTVSAVSKVKTLLDLQALVGDAHTLKPDEDKLYLIRSNDSSATLVRHWTGSDSLTLYETIYSPHDGGRSGHDRTALKNVRVGIVGLGSLGGKIAASLARAGVQNFELVDGDLLHVGNLERNDADWRDVGLHKVDVTHRRLRLLNPGVTCRRWRVAIGAQISSSEAGRLTAALSGCHLIIDATANDDVFNRLSGLVERSGATLVWGAVYAGGIGGEIARSRPKKDPSSYAIRGVLNRAYDVAEGPPPIVVGRGYDGSVGGELLIATDAAVTTIAAHMTDLALDALLDTEPSPFSAHAYLIGMRRCWLFDAPFDVRPIIADAPLRAATSIPEDTTLESEFVTTMLKGLDDEGDHS